MLTVVLDANVLISSVLSSRGAPRQIVAFWRQEAFTLLTSEPILAEVERVLRYPRLVTLHRLTDEEITEFVTLLREESRLVAPVEQLAISPDETDNRYIECAVAGGADYLVTGDKHHLLPIGEYRGISLITPATFVAILSDYG